MATTATKAEYAGWSGPLVLIVTYYVMQVPFVMAAPMEVQGGFVALIAYLLPRVIVYFAPPNRDVVEPLPQASTLGLQPSENP